MMMDYTIHKVSFLNFIAPNSFGKFQTILHTQLIFMYEVGKCPKHSGTDPLPLLRQCRDPMESLPSPRNIKIFKNRRRLRYCSYWSSKPSPKINCQFHFCLKGKCKIKNKNISFIKNNFIITYFNICFIEENCLT